MDEQSAAAASSPPDVGVALLSCAGAALANVRWPSCRRRMDRADCHLGCGGWLALNGHPGMDAAFDLVRHVEDVMASGFDDAHRDYETRKQIAKAKRDAWEKEVAAALKSVGTIPPMPDEAADTGISPLASHSCCRCNHGRLGVLAAGLPRGLCLCEMSYPAGLEVFDRYGGGGK